LELVKLSWDFLGAASLSSLARADKQWQKHDNPLAATLTQVALFAIACSQLSAFFEAKNIKPISMPKVALGAGTIFTVNLTADQKIQGVSRVCRTVSKKLSITFTLTHLMATLALLRLNKLKKASASLSGYFVAYMMNEAPKKLEEKAVKAATFYDRVSSCVFKQSPIFKTLAFVKYATYGEEYYSEMLYGVSTLKTCVNPTHLSIRPKPWFKSGEKGFVSDEMRKVMNMLKGRVSEEELSKIKSSSTAYQTAELPRLYHEYFKDEFSPEDALFMMLYQKQDEFLDQAFEEDYKAFATWFRRFSFDGTPQRINSYRLFYGQLLGFNLDFSRCDSTQFPEDVAFSRLIWHRYVIYWGKVFFDEYYTEKNLISWVLDKSFIERPQIVQWFKERNIYDIEEDAARYFLLSHGVLGSKR